MRCTLSIIYAVALILCLGTVAAPATFTVNDSGDSHDLTPGDGACTVAEGAGCSLRAALEEANALGGSDTILFVTGVSPIRLSLGALICSDNATVIAGLDAYPTIDGAGSPFATHILQIVSDSNQISGLTFRRAHYHGILVYGSDNMIGGETESDRNHFINNGLDTPDGAGIAIEGAAAVRNRIINNFVGMIGNGAEIRPNRTGLRLANNTAHNLVAGNLISGNDSCGLEIANGAHHNTVSGNIIGPDITGSAGPGNGSDGVRISNNASDNTIGGGLVTDPNLISLNRGNGVYIESAYRNTVAGNLIGLDDFGRTSLGNQKAGIRIADGADNTIGGGAVSERNVIAGNQQDGIAITGPSAENNIVIGNYVGIDRAGIRSRGNGQPEGHGIRIDSGATGNQIGDGYQGEGNVISGNSDFGVYVSGTGTYGNYIKNNLIGTNAFGSSSIPNGSGVAIRFGASRNLIGGSTLAEGNLISGNRAEIFPFGCGLLISDIGTQDNIVSGNYIGLDITGTRALRNGSSGVIIANGASQNLIGGETEGERNLIAGNGTGGFVQSLGRGIHITGTETAYNRVRGNSIGTAVDGIAVVENIGHGLAILGGAHHNAIGGDKPEAGNLIARNGGHGILLSNRETHSNRIRFNRIFDNVGLGIAVHDGAQNGVIPPVILAAGPENVAGTGAPQGGEVDIYRASPDPSGSGEGSLLIGSGSADSRGLFSITVYGLALGDTITAVGRDNDDNCSEFSVNFLVGAITDVPGHLTNLPTDFDLLPNYPNPFNPVTTIPFVLPSVSEVDLAVYNLLGQRVKTLIGQQVRAGTHSVLWDGTNENGNEVSSGVYFYRLQTDNFSASRKLLLLK